MLRHKITSNSFEATAHDPRLCRSELSVHLLPHLLSVHLEAHTIHRWSFCCLSFYPRQQGLKAKPKQVQWMDVSCTRLLTMSVLHQVGKDLTHLTMCLPGASHPARAGLPPALDAPGWGTMVEDVRKCKGIALFVRKMLQTLTPHNYEQPAKHLVKDFHYI